MSTNPNQSIPSYELGSLPVASSLLAPVGQIYDTYQRSRDVKKEIKARKAEAELAYQRQVEMWHMQNAYNSPEQQMARFGAAGLNPHLIYGRGSAGDAGSPPAYQPPQIATAGRSGPYGGAIASVLPTLMSVGTWMQNMRLSENRIQQSDQLVEFLKEKYPFEIRKFDQLESMYGYQRSQEQAGEQKAWTEWNRMVQENKHLYGLDGEGGMRELERILKFEQGRRTGLEVDWLSPTRIFGMVNSVVGRFLKPGRSISNVSRIKEIGKGERGRWSIDKKRWVPSKRVDPDNRKNRFGHQYRRP